jgi:sec-independent protein translocase protein TatB
MDPTFEKGITDVFGINGGEMIVLVLLAFFIIGPERIPGYAEQLKELVKKAKQYASGAKEGLVDTLGPEVAEVDWKKLDPRQYDRRTIVRQALLEDDDDPGRDAVLREEQRRVEEERALREEVEREQAEALAAVPPAELDEGLTAGPDTPEPALAGRGAGAPFDAEAT